MENRIVRQEEIVAIPQPSTDELKLRQPLSDSELRSLIRFFQLLDRWDREVVQ